MPETITQKINPPVLKQRRIVSLQTQSREADIFRLLRTKILKQLKAQQWNSFGITSVMKGSGKSMIAANLAAAIAMDVNQSVVLVDMDLLNPSLAWYFDLTVTAGLTDALVTKQPLAELLINPGISRLEILPIKEKVRNSSEILTSPQMRSLIQQLKTAFNDKIIIFDLPPVLVADDVLVSMDYYDALLFVIEDGANSIDDIKRALQLIADKPLLGTVLNKADKLPSYQNYY